MKPHSAITLAASLAFSASAMAQTVSVTVSNNDTQDLFVAVFDQNQSGQVVYNQRLNEGASTGPLAVTADGNGNGSVAWKVVTTSTPQQTECGNAPGLSEGAEVNVISWGSSASPC
jgi:hypothetical protein